MQNSIKSDCYAECDHVRFCKSQKKFFLGVNRTINQILWKCVMIMLTDKATGEKTSAGNYWIHRDFCLNVICKIRTSLHWVCFALWKAELLFDLFILIYQTETLNMLLERNQGVKDTCCTYIKCFSFEKRCFSHLLYILINGPWFEVWLFVPVSQWMHTSSKQHFQPQKMKQKPI